MMFESRPGRVDSVRRLRTVCGNRMAHAKPQLPKLLDRALIGLLIFIVLVLIGVQVVHAG